MTSPDITTEDIENVSQSTRDFLWNHHRFASLTVIVASVVTSGMVLVFPPHFIQVSIILLFVPVIIYGMYVNKMHHLMMQQLAQSISFHYAATTPIESVSGKLFENGRSRKIEDVLTGAYNEYPARIFTYYYTVPEGKSSHTYTNTVFQLTYIAPLPHILLCHNSFFFSGDLEKVELEGIDFNKEFNLYVQTDKQMEVREIFEPDVMAQLLDSFQEYSLEIKDSNIYILREGTLASKKEFMDMRTTVNMLFQHIIPELHSVAH